MKDTPEGQFDPLAFLSSMGPGRKIVQLKSRERFFIQGDLADSVYYLQTGRVKLTVASSTGKEAAIAFLATGDFLGEDALAGISALRISTAIAIASCTAIRIDRQQMLCALREQHSLSDLFMRFLLTRSLRIQENLIDQLFNSSEKRLARLLLSMAKPAGPGELEIVVPSISQGTLAEMIGTTRSRVSYFMNRFRKLGLVQYNGDIFVHRSRLNIVLRDGLPDEYPDFSSKTL